MKSNDTSARQGLIHLYFGDGKGKTTAAMGLCARMLGSGGRVLLVQFLKDGSSSEIGSLRRLGAEVLCDTRPAAFTFCMNDTQKQNRRHDNDDLLAQAEEVCRTAPVDLLVLDEAIGAAGLGMLDETRLLAFLKSKPQGLEVVLTGRDPSPELLDAADYASEVCKRKHPYDRGICARPGIEY